MSRSTMGGSTERRKDRTAGIMRRHGWLATGIILLGLQAPLCALACSEAPVRASTVAQDAEPPCHRGEAEAPAGDKPRSHDDCGCASSVQALTTADAEISNSVAQGVVPRNPSWNTVALNPSRVVPVPPKTDLPPPDILLLESVLLI